MSTSNADLELLLSLQDDRVLETPPASPSAPHRSHIPGYNSDDGSPKGPRAAADMSAFRDTVKGYINIESITAESGLPRSHKTSTSGDVLVEKLSGLRIRKQLVSSLELANRFSEIRFVRLPAIRNLLPGDSVSGCWATVGVLTEKGAPRLSSAGKSYCIWKMGCLDESNVSIFLFGDAYSQNCGEPVGTVFALFNSTVRRDAGGKGFSGFSLSVYSAGQILKVGTSADYGICKGKRKDGVSCTMVINRRQGAYCKYHTSNSSQKYSTMRAELKGGNIRMATRLQSEGIFMVNPQISNSRKPAQRVKVMSVDGLKKALSKADTVTTMSQSQGKRFLAQVTANLESKVPSKGAERLNKSKGLTEKRPTLVSKASSTVVKNQQPEAKRKKTDHSSDNLIELEIASSDED